MCATTTLEALTATRDNAVGQGKQGMHKWEEQYRRKEWSQGYMLRMGMVGRSRWKYEGNTCNVSNTQNKKTEQNLFMLNPIQ